jgi:nicotinate-nucleotide pyrophosphorylase (carboxylating)
MTSWDDVPPELREEIEAAGLDLDRLWAKLVEAFAEDLPEAPPVDPTSESTIPADERSEAVFGAREDGVVAGLAIAAAAFFMVGSEATITDRLPDGTRVAKGDVVMRITGLTQRMLVAERTALNLASHLSGIATATARWVDALEGSPTRVLDTRKTLPGLRALQKYAVRCGGGVNHRFSLQDMAMVKDNHVVAAGGVLPALEAIRGRHPGLPVEVEVTTLGQLEELLALAEPPERILLDNMDDATTEKAVQQTRGRAILEASGGITLERIAALARAGVDAISVGALTHSTPAADISLDFVAAK